jgi:hypothetical protein
MEKGNVDNIIKVKQKNALANTIEKKGYDHHQIFLKNQWYLIKKKSKINCIFLLTYFNVMKFKMLKKKS